MESDGTGVVIYNVVCVIDSPDDRATADSVILAHRGCVKRLQEQQQIMLCVEAGQWDTKINDDS